MKKNKKNNCKINKCMETKNFVKVSNDVIQSKEISLAAKGLLVYILSLPSDWFLLKGDMHKQLGMTRRAVEKAFNELVAAGFIASAKTQTQGGWSYSYEIFSRFPNSINIQNNEIEEEFIDVIPTEPEVEIEYENKEVNDNNTMIIDNETLNNPTQNNPTQNNPIEELENKKEAPMKKQNPFEPEGFNPDPNLTPEEYEKAHEDYIISTMPKEFAKKPKLSDYGYPEEPAIAVRKKPIEKEESNDEEEDFTKMPVWSEKEEALYRLNETKTLGTYSKEYENLSILDSVVVEKEVKKKSLKQFLNGKNYPEDFLDNYEKYKNGVNYDNDRLFQAGLKHYDDDLKEFEELQQ